MFGRVLCCEGSSGLLAPRGEVDLSGRVHVVQYDPLGLGPSVVLDPELLLEEQP